NLPGTSTGNPALACGTYTCDGIDGNCRNTCTTDAQCAAGDYCNGSGKCVAKLANGATCDTLAVSGAAGSCQSGFCVDTYGCNPACTGGCNACSAAQTGNVNGVCAPISNGGTPKSGCAAQAASTCGNTGLCNGAGGCQLYANGTQCGAPNCNGNTPQTHA